MASINNLDEKHNEMLNLFYYNETEKIHKLQNKKGKLLEKLSKLNNTRIDEVLDIKDEINELSKQIKNLKTQRKKYYLDNSKYIFDFYEKKKEISSSTTMEKPQNAALNSFFKIKAVNSESSDLSNDKYNQSKLSYKKYWHNINKDVGTIQDYLIVSDICESCNDGELIPQDDEGILICNNKMCGQFITYIIDSSKPNNKDPPNEVSYTAYIRLNHFKEILSQFQAKESTQIPETVITAIKARIKKERITDMKEINYDKMREILRKLGLNKYFEHIQYINSLFGIKPPIMNEELHETLCVLFIEIQKPWAVHCPPNRTNFFNYTYTLYQLCVLLDQTQYLPYIPMMKDREKQLEQDMIWKKVSNDLDWQYFPTV